MFLDNPQTDFWKKSPIWLLWGAGGGVGGGLIWTLSKKHLIWFSPAPHRVVKIYTARGVHLQSRAGLGWAAWHNSESPPAPQCPPARWRGWKSDLVRRKGKFIYLHDLHANGAIFWRHQNKSRCVINNCMPLFWSFWVWVSEHGNILRNVVKKK